MSREIKFRAWDKRDKKYLNNAQNTWMNSTCFGDLLASPNFEIEQYTGLKDANGKDIYEGDVVRVFDVYEDVGYVDVVIWGGKDDYPAFDLKNHARDYDANALSSIFNGDFEIIEVIGNLHTNSELLEADK